MSIFSCRVFFESHSLCRGSGGFFAGKVAAPDAEAPVGGRFDGNSAMGKMYRARYLKSGYFDALNYLKPIAVRPSVAATLPPIHSFAPAGEAPVAPDGDRPAVVPAPLRSHPG